MHRFFIDPKNAEDRIARITGDDVHHINRVLRLKEDDRVSLSNGEGMDFEGRIVNIDRDEVTVEIEKRFPSEGESDINIKVYQGVPKGDKMELIIQKSVELGVNEIIPVQTARAVSKIEKGKKMQKKLERWQKISESAAQQSRRGIIPAVDRVLSFKELLSEMEKSVSDGELAVVFFENEEQQPFKDMLKNFKGKDISIIIGPEGGFEDREIEELMERGVKSASLGKRILRTETVSLAASSIIMYELGDLGEI